MDGQTESQQQNRVLHSQSDGNKTYAISLQMSPYNTMLISSFKSLAESFKMFVISSFEQFQHLCNLFAICILT